MKQRKQQSTKGYRFEVAVVSGHDFPIRQVVVRASDHEQAGRRAVQRAERVYPDREFVALDARKCS